IRAGPVALGLRVPAGTSDDANGDLSAKPAPGAGTAARAAIVDVRQSVHAAPATALQTAVGVWPAVVVAVGAAAAPVGDIEACRAVLTAGLAAAAPTGVPTGAPTLDADPARTAERAGVTSLLAGRS